MSRIIVRSETFQTTLVSGILNRNFVEKQLFDTIFLKNLLFR